MADHATNPTAGGGGFIPTLPSPAPSTNSTLSLAGLPHPRGHALRPGSAKEDKVRNHVSSRIAHINRRFIKKGAFADPNDDVPGYKNMAELCNDLDGVINILWLSGTPSLQIPYLLNIASEFNTWLRSFPPSPKATLSILRKLDHCFASLLAGEDIETKEPLPGFENGPRAGMTRTHMVRCKSTVQQARMVVMNVMSEEPDEEDGAEGTPGDAESDSDDDGPTDWGKVALKQKQNLEAEEDEEQNLDIARVYEKTIVQLGIALAEGEALGEIRMSED